MGKKANYSAEDGFGQISAILARGGKWGPEKNPRGCGFKVFGEGKSQPENVTGSSTETHGHGPVTLQRPIEVSNFGGNGARRVSRSDV